MAPVILAAGLIYWAVVLLLLIGTQSLCGYPLNVGRLLPASCLAGVYACLCLLPGLGALGGWMFRCLVMVIVCVFSFGFHTSALRRGGVFLVLMLALGGVLAVLEDGGGRYLVLSALGLCAVCRLLLRGRIISRSFATVELTYQGKHRTLTALLDTGNTLTDPVTGQQVLVVDGELAWELCGLSREMLRDPIGTMGRQHLPGLRLIPYRSVGQPGGMLLAVRMDDVRIRGQQADPLVAFAPDGIGAGEGYQALAGGVI